MIIDGGTVEFLCYRRLGDHTRSPDERGLLISDVCNRAVSLCFYYAYMYMYILTISIVLSVQYVTELELFGYYLVGI